MHNFPTYFWRKFQQHKDDIALRLVDAQGATIEKTYWEWTRRVQRLAIALLDAGFTPGDRIAMTPAGGRDWLDLAFASWLVGGCLVVLPPNQPRVHLLRALARTGSSWVVVRDGEQKRFLRGDESNNFPPHLRWVCFDKSAGDPGGESLIYLEDLDREGRSLAVRGWVDKLARAIYAVAAEQPSLILFESQLGEDPHGAHFSGTKVKELLDALGDDLQFDDDSCVLTSVAYGNFPSWLLSAAALLQGRPVAIAPTLEIGASNLHKLNPTHLICGIDDLEARAQRFQNDLQDSVPSLQADGGNNSSTDNAGLGRLLGQLGRDAARKLFSDPLSREFGTKLQAVYVLGGDVAPELRELLMRNNIHLLGLFARPECGISHLERLSAPRPGSRGRPVQTFACKIDGARREEAGQVLVRSHLLFDGYWDDKGPRHIDDHGWLHTGATGSLQSGFLFLNE